MLTRHVASSVSHLQVLFHDTCCMSSEWFRLAAAPFNILAWNKDLTAVLYFPTQVWAYYITYRHGQGLLSHGQTVERGGGCVRACAHVSLSLSLCIQKYFRFTVIWTHSCYEGNYKKICINLINTDFFFIISFLSYHYAYSYGELLREHEEVLTHWRQQTNGEDWQELYHQLEVRWVWLCVLLNWKNSSPSNSHCYKKKECWSCCFFIGTMKTAKNGGRN